MTLKVDEVNNYTMTVIDAYEEYLLPGLKDFVDEETKSKAMEMSVNEHYTPLP